MGTSPLSWQDIHAWTLIRNRKPSPTELDLIRAIDSAFLETQAAKE